jgi:hypothetical protein
MSQPPYVCHILAGTAACSAATMNPIGLGIATATGVGAVGCYALNDMYNHAKAIAPPPAPAWQGNGLNPHSAGLGVHPWANSGLGFRP